MDSLGTRDGFDYVGNGRAKKEDEEQKEGKREKGMGIGLNEGKTREKEREWQGTSGKLPDQRVTYVRGGITVRIPTMLT